MREKRVERCKELIAWLKHNESMVKIFSDKKVFTVDQVRNSRNDGFLAFCADTRSQSPKQTHPAMMLLLVASDDKRMAQCVWRLTRTWTS